ncbi:hypothetical protein CWE24_09560 [Pseudidiomarina donghaiensis]|uniref:Uncharacterized protein n=1 Tax=Pseudidiomarina donghaiensis TaxID=519452 RepID=A0A432XFK8_9GAMM|nr:hypothetical protein CWE24_09560 [Pseudidiomarina donghaiensis]
MPFIDTSSGFYRASIKCNVAKKLKGCELNALNFKMVTYYASEYTKKCDIKVIKMTKRWTGNARL